MGVASGVGRLVCSAAMLAAALAPPADALDARRAPSQYVIRKWGVQSLRSNTVFTLVQSRDRYIWLGTTTGLVRYDGDRFVTFNGRNTPQFGDGGASALSEGADGSLYVGTTSGLILRYKDGTFSQPLVNPMSGSVSALLAARDGTLWIGGYGKNVLRFRNGTIEGSNVPSQAPLAIIQDEKGNVWVATKNRGVLRHDGRELHEGAYTQELIQALYVDRAGTLWIGTPHGLLRVREDEVHRLTPKDGLSHENVTAVLEDRDGNLWVGTGGGGLNRLANGRWSRLTSSFDGLSDDDIRALLEDHEGNLWVGTADGLNCISEGPFVTYGRLEGLRDVAITAVGPAADGGTWIGTASGEVTLLRDGREIHHLSLAGARGRDAVLALREMRDGAVWFALDSQRLLRFRNGTVTEHTLELDVQPRTVRAFFEDEQGPIFLVTALGFSRLVDGRFVGILPDVKSTERYPRYPHMALRDLLGAYWLADRGGLARFSDGKWTLLTAQNGLPNDRVRWMSVDADGSIWAATLGGLCHVKNGVVRTLTIAQGLPENHLRLVIDDGIGSLWLASAGQIFRVEKLQVLEVLDGKRPRVDPVVYDTSDGLRTTEILLSNNPGFRADDGRIWFATAKGVAVVNPRQPTSRVPPPVVHVEEVAIDKVAFDIRKSISAEPGQGDLVIRYTGLSFVTPERVRFRYQLEGYDRGFVDAENRRVAYYTNIPPGRYKFRVTARNGEGAWSDTDASVALYLAPHFYQTRTFLSVCALTVLVAVFAVHRVRVRYLEKQKQELAASVEDGLAQIKVLRGLLPTCASCKKIRDEGGSWNHMESYIRDHSEANFSHSVCPECMERLYPDAYGSMKQ